jgi:hypothetical protein
MLRPIVGITGISLWVLLIALVVGLQAKASGEQMFESLPEGWKVEKSFAASKEQTAAIARKLGGRILKLTNTVLSIGGRRLQVNVLHCPTAREAEKIYKAVLEAHNGLATSAAKDGKMVIEFAKSNDVELMHEVRQALGLPDARLDSVTGKFIRNIPDGWQIQESFIVPQAQTVAIGKKLGGRIKNLSNTIFSVKGKQIQVNVVECATPGAAKKIHESILKMKPDPAFCLLLGNSVVEFVGDDVELAKKAVYELGIKPGRMESMATDLVDLLVKKDYAEAVKIFDSTMKKELPAEKLQEVWNSIIAQAGAFKEQLGVRKERILPYEVVFVTCKFERAVLDAKVVFNQKQQVAGLFFVPSQ